MTVPELPTDLDSRIRGISANREFEEVVKLLAADLIAYQNIAYSSSFLDLVEALTSAERRVGVEDHSLSTVAARSLHQLMAYKDEYEVARLLLSPEAQAVALEVGGIGATVTWKLHPPALSALGFNQKIGVPMRVGRPAMTALARGKSLRGTRADPFGRTEVRKVERRILNEFEAALRTVASELTFELMPAARHIASLPQTVRGYEQLKLQRAAAFTTELRSAITAFRRPPEREAR